MTQDPGVDGGSAEPERDVTKVQPVTPGKDTRDHPVPEEIGLLEPERDE